MSRKSRKKLMQRVPHKAMVEGDETGKSAGGAHQNWIFGHHAGLAAIANPERKVLRIVVSKQSIDDGLMFEIKDAVNDAGITRPGPEQKDRAALDDIFGWGAVHQGLAVQVANLEQPELEDLIDLAQSQESACIVILDQATDPRNIGAVMRSAAAFGAMGLVVQDRNAPEMTATMAKAASGAAERLPLVRVTNISRAIDDLKKNEFWAIGLDGSADEVLDRKVMKGRIALVLGAEGSGLRRLVAETCDRLVKIPILGSVESLNLSNAAAVALYSFSESNRAE